MSGLFLTTSENDKPESENIFGFVEAGIATPNSELGLDESAGRFSVSPNGLYTSSMVLLPKMTPQIPCSHIGSIDCIGIDLDATSKAVTVSKDEDETSARTCSAGKVFATTCVCNSSVSATEGSAETLSPPKLFEQPSPAMNHHVQTCRSVQGQFCPCASQTQLKESEFQRVYFQQKPSQAVMDLLILVMNPRPQLHHFECQTDLSTAISEEVHS